MIKVSASVCGTIVRDALITTNEKGVTNLEFTMRVLLPSRSNDNMSIDIPVLVSNGKREEIKDYVRGGRIVMKGNLSIHKADDELVFVLSEAEPQVTYSVPSEDSIKGDMEFTGKVKEFAKKTDKRGLPYLIITASSPDKVGRDHWERIWIHFKRFTAKGEEYESIHPDWLKEGINIDILGDIQFSTFNKRVNLSSRISEMALKEE